MDDDVDDASPEHDARCDAMRCDAMLGRVGALFLTVNAGARPIGAALGRLVGSHLGEAACLRLALAGVRAASALIMRSQIGRLQRLPDAIA